MECQKKYIHVGIGFTVLGLTMISFAYDYSMQNLFTVVRCLQVTATVSLLFGTLKKDPQHKDKFLLFWLIMTVAVFTSLVYGCFDYLFDDFSSWDFGDFLVSLIILLAEIAAVGIVGYSMYLIYKEYAELTKSPAITTLRVPDIHVPGNVIETKEAPPAYIMPTSDTLAVSIQS